MAIKTISRGQEHISVLRSYICKLQEPKDYGEKAGIVAYLFADAIANDKFPRYANKPYKDQINTLTTVPCVQTSILYLS